MAATATHKRHQKQQPPPDHLQSQPPLQQERGPVTRDQARALRRRLPLPSRLEFFAWWREPSQALLTKGGVRNDMRITHDTATGGFTLTFADGVEVAVSHAADKRGRRLDPWDLHVGGRVPLLGRHTTLRQAANQTTLAWLASETAFLTGVRTALADTLRKYGLFARAEVSAAALAAQRDAACGGFRTAPAPGSADLRKIFGEIDQLHAALADVEPREAWLLTSHVRVTATAAAGAQTVAAAAAAAGAGAEDAAGEGASAAEVAPASGG